MSVSSLLTDRITPAVIKAVTAGLMDCIPDEWGKRFPHYLAVPKGLKENLLWRQRTLEAGSKDRCVAEILRQMCAEDLLFFVNAFCWTFSPKDETKSPSRPFITWPYQDVFLLVLQDAMIDGHGLHVRKSRDMGATEMLMKAFAHALLFGRLQTMLCLSKKEDSVDQAGNRNTLFAKVDFTTERLPKWLFPELTRKNMLIENKEGQNAINGDSTTSDSYRGGRGSALFVDEHATIENDKELTAAIEDVADCKIYVATPQGQANEFYRIWTTDIFKVDLHWPLHPLKAAGLYYDESGKPRSPWYDGKTSRLPRWHVAQEYDMDFVGSTQRYFEADFIEQYSAKYAREPVLVGDFVKRDGGEWVFKESSSGRMKLWMRPDASWDWPTDRNYVVAADVSFGTGASNSVIGAADKKTGEKILEYVDPDIRPGDLAEKAIAVARWLNSALLIWENNGPGRMFTTTVRESRYPHLYYAKKEHQYDRPDSETAGFATTNQSKYEMFGRLYNAYRDEKYKNPSKEALQESLEYVYVPSTRGIEHSKASGEADPSGARENHGDRVIVDGLLVIGLEELYDVADSSPAYVFGSLAHRRHLRQKARAEREWY